ncbi:MAG: hypothetical protein FD143_2941 [Ignavibacteria bacterium]|nr:MAG: hypothetical protein FD143_2941 [Ignavibacteria bacterium]KAF0157950.1 MAG: hypothetical protein FD188_2645 [Ignavibacteria bacterium]
MKRKLILLLFGLLLISLRVFAQEEESNSSPSFYLQTAAANMYAWRGIVYDQGLVVQPTLGVNYKNWTFQLWGNITAIEEGGFPTNHELDFILQYKYELGDFTISPYLQMYTYPFHEEDSAIELFLSCDYSLADFTLNTTLSRDINLGVPLVFGTHSISYAKAVGYGFNFDASSGLGWGTKNFNNYHIGIEKGAVNFIFANTSLSYALTDKLSITPYLESFFIIDNEIKEATNSSLVNFGINVSISFNVFK